MRLGLGLALGRSKSAAGGGVPALSSASVSAASATTTTAPSIYTTGTDGTIYFRLYLATATPTDPEIIAGTGAAVAEGLAVSAAGTKTFTAAAGLTSATYYTAYFVHVGVSETSAITTVTNILTYPGIVSASGTPSITVETGVGDPTVTVTDTDTSEVLFTGTVSAANLALAAYNLVSPSISVVGGADPAVGEQIQDDVADVWTVNPPGAYSRGLQYDSDAVAISGATSSPFTVTASESDSDITLDVTVNTVTATSSAIVIPAAPFDPVTDLANLVGIWDAGDETSITDTGGQVTQIADLSAAGTNLTNTANANILTGVAADDINSRNVLSFLGSRTLQSSGTPLVTDNYEFMMLVQPSNITNKDLFGTGGTSNGDILVQIGGSINNVLWTSAGAQAVTGPSVSLDEVLIAHVYVDGTTIYAGKNGVGSTGTVAGTKAGASKNIVLGARTFNNTYAFVGGFGYGAFTDTPWSLADKNALGQYLATLGGISWTTMT